MQTNKNACYRIFVLLLVFVLFFTSGCSAVEMIKTQTDANYNYTDISLVSAPKNNKIILEGTWKVMDIVSPDTPNVYAISSNKSANEEDILTEGMIVGFYPDSVIAGGKTWEQVTYKLKRVKKDEYLTLKNINDFNYIDARSKYIFSVIVSSEGKFLFEFLIINNTRIAAIIGKQCYVLVRTMQNDEQPAIERKEEVSLMSKTEDKIASNGVLLGIKTQIKSTDEDQINTPGSFVYRTLWISSDQNGLKQVYESPNIFMPRRDGFWRMYVEKQKINNGSEDIFIFENITSNKSREKTYEQDSGEFWTNNKGFISKSITFLGNDYISASVTGKGKEISTQKEWKIYNLRTYPIDAANNSRGITITDIYKENGRNALLDAISELGEIQKNIQFEELERSFGLYRNTGHWFLRCRLQMQDIESEKIEKYKDIKLNLLPTKDMVMYDNLVIPWKVIKEKIPRARDIITSPNGDFAVVLLLNEIHVYGISGEQLSDKPQIIIPSYYGDVFIMAEWCTGQYVEKWEKAFIKYANGKKLQ